MGGSPVAVKPVPEAEILDSETALNDVNGLVTVNEAQRAPFDWSAQTDWRRRLWGSPHPGRIDVLNLQGVDIGHHEAGSNERIRIRANCRVAVANPTWPGANVTVNWAGLAALLGGTVMPAAGALVRNAMAGFRTFVEVTLTGTIMLEPVPFTNEIVAVAVLLVETFRKSMPVTTASAELPPLSE